MLEMYIMMVVPRQQQQASRQIINVFYSQKYIQVQCHYNNRQGTVRLILGFFASVLHLSTFETQRRGTQKKKIPKPILSSNQWNCINVMMIIKIWIKNPPNCMIFECYLKITCPALLLYYYARSSTAKKPRKIMAPYLSFHDK